MAGEHLPIWQVAYAPEGLLEKNKDTVYRDQRELLAASAAPLLAALFAEDKKRASVKRPETAGLQFRKQMDELAATIGRCAEPHYIRTIKPNAHKQATPILGR